MAGHQRRKLSNGNGKLETCTSELYRTRKKHARPTEDCFNAKSHVTLEWDASKKRVIAIKEQVGISWRSLRPFFDSLPHCRDILADTFDIPEEIFDLDNLEEVLSQEVWQTCLSESERKYLMQFLPAEAEVQQIVKPLFAGDNFHFGNPVLQWGTSLRSGNMHPDTVVQRERRLKAEKKAYYADLQKYHNDIIGSLLKLKENWESCNDPEAVSGNILSSKKDIRRKLSSSSNGFVVEEGVAGSSESSSWMEDERTDNHISSSLKGGNSQQRMNKKTGKKDFGPTFVSHEDDLDTDLTSMNGDKIRKTGELSNDGAKYMSYIKISKKQHEIAKNMEKSGDSMHSKSLGPLLGDLQNYQIQPYEVLLEEQRKTLNEHWLNIAKDLPSIHASWRNHQLRKHEIIMSLNQELLEKLDSLMEEEASVEEISDAKLEEGLANSSEEKLDIDESTLDCHVEKNDDEIDGLSDRTNDEDSERVSQQCQSEEATRNFDEVEVNRDDPIVSSSLDPRGFFTRMNNTSTMGQNSNSGGDSDSDDLRGQVNQNRKNAFIMEENANHGDDSSYHPSLELPSQNQLLNEVTTSCGKLSNGFDTSDFEFQNNQASSKLESAPQPENILPFSAKSGLVNSHGVILNSGGTKNQNNQISFRSEDSPQPHVSAYSPRLGSASMIISHGVPLASGGLEDQRNQITVKPEDAQKPEAVSVFSAMSDPTNMVANHGVPVAPSVFGARRNQNPLKPEGVPRSEDVLLYSTTSGSTDMIAGHGVHRASSGFECHRNQIALESDDVSAFSARRGPTGMIARSGVPIASARIEVQRSQLTLKSQDARLAGDVSAYSARLGPANMMNSHGVQLTSNGEIWQPASVMHSDYGSAASFSNGCTTDLTLPEMLIRPEHQGQWSSIECSLPGGAELLQGQTNQGSSRHFQEPDQNDLLQSLLKGQGVISYNHEQKFPGLNFQQSNNMLMGNSRIPDHFLDQRRLPLPMEPGHKGGNVIYMQQNVVDNGSSNLVTFPPQGREQLLPPNIPDWPINSVRFSESLACSVPGGDLSSQNWFTGEHYVRGGWTGAESNCAPSESLGNLDQSLYSVLPPCNQLRPTAPYSSIGQADRFIPARTYEMVDGRNVSVINNVLPHSVQSLDYMNRRDATNALVANDPGWMNLPQQNPGLNDAVGKPFMGSWDQ